MPTDHEPRPAVLGKRLMFTLLAVAFVIVLGVLYAYGVRDPSKGPGNLPPGGAAASQPQGGLPADK